MLTDDHIRKISEAIHGSLTSTFNVPPKDRFQVLTRHEGGEIVCAEEYLDIVHSGNVLFIQIHCNEGRTVEMKRALYADIVASVTRQVPILPADIVINLVEVKKENWSFGNGIAQYAA
jgi:phenylpyruvate tautomerase PptA (4-oxalocrotonate tautomerase family)